MLAVGAGLAIIAALASQSGADDREKSSDLKAEKSVLEDDCHDMLQYRIRGEQDPTARDGLKNSRVAGHDLKGEATVRYTLRNAQRASYTCHFNHNGRLKDSQYHIY